MATPYASRDGTTGFNLQSVNSVFATQSGWTNVYVYVGPVDGLSAFLATIAQGYTKIEIAEEGPQRSVTLTYGGGESYDPEGTVTTPPDPISRVFTMQGNAVQKPFLESDQVRALFTSAFTGTFSSQAFAEEVAKIQAQMRAYRKAVDDADDVTTVLLETYRNALDSDWSKQAFDRLIIDDDMFETSQFVLTVVEEVSNGTAVRAQYDYVDRLMTTAFLKGVESFLDAATIIAIDTLESSQGPIFWKYQAPTVTSTLGGKVEVTRSYWAYKAYDAWRYGNALGS
jgi:hypothetical protein